MACVLAVIECVVAIYWCNIIVCLVAVNAVMHIAPAGTVMDAD